MENVDKSALGQENVIDILENDKSEKMTYKTGYVLGDEDFLFQGRRMCWENW